MGLSSFFNPDILIGMGRARDAERKNLLTQETERRGKATSLLTKIFDSEDSLPETREEALRQIGASSMADPSKPFKFDFDKIISVRPQVGKSVSRTQSQELPDVGANQYGLTPQSLGLGASELRAPEAPQDYRRSGFYSPEEQQSRQLDTYRQQRRITTDEDIRAERAKQQSELEFNTLNPPKPSTPSDFTLSPGQTRYGPDGKVIANIPDAPNSSASKSLQPDEVVLKDGKREMVLFNPDPATPGWFRKDPASGQLIDITSQVAGQYRQPPPASATIQITNATQMPTGTPDELMSGVDRATLGPNWSPGAKLKVVNSVKAALARNDMNGARAMIRQAALDGESATLRQNVQGRREALKALNDIKAQLSTIPTNLVVGTIEDIARKLGTTKDPKYVAVATRLQALNQAYRKAVTGAQFSQQEAAEYVKLFPNLYNTAPVNSQLIDSLTTAMGSNDSAYWDYKLGPGWSDTLNPISAPNGEVQRQLPDGSTGTFRINPDGSATRIR